MDGIDAQMLVINNVSAENYNQDCDSAVLKLEISDSDDESDDFDDLENFEFGGDIIMNGMVEGNNNEFKNKSNNSSKKPNVVEYKSQFEENSNYVVARKNFSKLLESDVRSLYDKKDPRLIWNGKYTNNLEIEAILQHNSWKYPEQGDYSTEDIPDKWKRYHKNACSLSTQVQSKYLSDTKPEDFALLGM